MRVAVLALTLVVAASGRAAAADNDGSASPFESRPTAIYAELGLGAPLGLVGVEVEETILPNLSLSAGAGWGAANAPQGAAMLRWLGGNHWSRFTIGAGISGGQYKWTDSVLLLRHLPVQVRDGRVGQPRDWLRAPVLERVRAPLLRRLRTHHRRQSHLRPTGHQLRAVLSERRVQPHLHRCCHRLLVLSSWWGTLQTRVGYPIARVAR